MADILVGSKTGTVSRNSTYVYTLGRVYVTAQSAINNTSTIRVETCLAQKDTSGSVYFEGQWEGYIRIDGTYYNKDKTYMNLCNPWPTPKPATVVFQSKSITLSHDANGNKNVDIWQKFYDRTSYGPGLGYITNSTTAWSVALPKIDRTGTSISNFRITSTGTTSVSFGYSATGADYLWHSLSGGSYVASNGTVSGLKANTTYTLKIKVRKASNHVTTESGTITFTTHPNTVTISSVTVSDITPFTATVNASVSSPNDVSSYTLYVRTPNGSGSEVSPYPKTVTLPYTITELQPETPYQIILRAHTKSSGATNDKWHDGIITTPADKFVYTVQPNGVVSDKLKMYLIDTNGVKTEVKKDKVKVL